MSCRRSTPADFWKRVNKSTNEKCWEWTGALDTGGYGTLSYQCKKKIASRLSYELTYGQIPPGFDVLHRCDNTKCVNPNHLFLGTQLDNMRDCVAKNRMPKGSENPFSKLTESDVIRIRQLYSTGAMNGIQLANKFGIRSQTVYQIIHRQCWTHI